MASNKLTASVRRLSRRTVLKGGAAALSAAAFPMPAFAQSKPYSGVTLHGASFQHRFFTLLQNYIPEFEDKTGMKVDLQLSAFPVYNQQANLELSSGGSAYDFCNVTSSSPRAGSRRACSPISTSSRPIPTSRRPNGIRKTSSTARRCRIATPREPLTAIPGKAAPW